jgi:hypothetical protein
MDLHEFQGKSILKKYGVSVPEGILAESPEQAVEAAKHLHAITGTKFWVVKAQIHAGGRGKGGGVKLAKNVREVEKFTDKIIGMNLITPQTPPEGKKVSKVLIQQDVFYPGPSDIREFYISVLLNRKTGRNMIMYSPIGGMDIEAVAEKTPDQIFTEEIDPRYGLQGFQARRVAFNLSLEGDAFKNMVKFVQSLYKAYLDSDATLFEINPVLKASAFTNYTGFWYNFTFFIMIVAFTYFYTAITVNPNQMADDMKKNGGFIPGIKPGKKTAEFIDNVMSRITFPGSIFLGLVAIMPAFVGIAGVSQQFAGFYGGTSLLILVGVVLDTLDQINSHLLMRHYDGLTKSGRIKGRSG